MNINLIIQCLVAGFLGIAVQVILKLIALRNRSAAANTPFRVADYFTDDWLTLLLSIVTVVIGVYVLDELIAYKPEVASYVKFFFIAVGYMGSSILHMILSVTEKKILKVIDVKTDIADDTVVNTTDVQRTK